MMRLKNKISLLLMFSLFSGLLPFERQMMVARGETELVTRARDEAAKLGPKGLRFRLSEGAEQPEQRSTSAAAPAVKLSESDTQRVLARLPALNMESGDEQDFAMRERSLPAPRTGRVINTSFPALEEQRPPDASSTGPLEVLRHAPEGEIPLAPQLSVTFSQPMVAVTSYAELEAAGVPVRLTPQPAGKWRWVGTKTLLFVPDGRFPMATEYRVTVPAGTKSANGGALPATKAWSFATPAPVLKTGWPRDNGPQRRDVLMFAEFDQRIDPARVLPTIHVNGAGRELKIRLATDAEIASDETVSRLAAAAEKGRWLAFRAIDPATNDFSNALPPNSGISVTIGPGTPSAEGPRTTPQAQSFSFNTYGPLLQVSQNCEADDKCSPFDQWYVTFSNPLDAGLQKSQVRVEPEIAGMRTTVNGNYLMIEGIKPGRRSYRVTLAPTIKDTFGQTLEGNRSVTFHVGPAEKSLTSSRDGFIVLDPNAQGRYSVFSVNHSKLKVSLYKVGPENWNQFVNHMRWSQGYADENAKKNRVPPGKLVVSKLIDVAAKPDELVETPIDLSPALADGLGQVFVIVEPAIRVKGEERVWIKAWVQVTNIGLDAFVDNTDLIGWATSLRDARPLAGVEMAVQPGGNAATSGADGLAHIVLNEPTQSDPNILVARQGRDLAILPEHTEWYYTNGGWFKKEAGDALRWFVFDDRKMYRPGEEVHIKGWLRKIGGTQTGDVGPVDGTTTSVDYVLRDSRGNEVGKGAMKINALGGFDTAFKLPGTMNLGSANLQLTATGGTGGVANAQTYHSFQVQEFRRPEFEVKAQATAEGPFFVGSSADTFVTAAYYAGGGLSNTDVTWSVTATPTNYTPPNRWDYTFGKWIAWWARNPEESESHTETFQGKTDAAGKHRLHIDFDGVNPPRPTSVRAEASVMDVNRQTLTSGTSLIVHPADLYVGLKSERTFVEQGQPLVVQSIVTDLDGKAVANRAVKMRAERLDWVYENYRWQQKAGSAQSCAVQSGNDAVQCVFDSKEGGQYRITASVMDDKERFNESELTLWVAGGKEPPQRGVEQQTVNLIPDRKDYQPNDVAEILVQAPFYPAEGVLTLRRSGLVKTERFRVDGPSLTLKVPIQESYTPNLIVQVDLNGAAVRVNDEGVANDKLPKRPAFASGQLNLSIPPLSRKLAVTATPRDKAVEPGGETQVEVSVKDARGEPVANSEVAVVVVDESVLALSGYRVGDPLDTFYAQREGGASDYHSRANVLLTDPEALKLRSQQGVLNGRGMALDKAATSEVTVLAAQTRVSPSPSAPKRRARGGLRDSVGKDDEDARAEEPQQEQSIRVRENFNALAVFSPAVATDSNGRAQVSVKVPDNLTRYRIMAVSVAGGKQFGAGESSLTARQPLMARPSAPRFLNFGDHFELPIVLQNQTDQPMSVDVAVRAANAELTDGAGRRVMVPANDRVEVRLPVAARRVGTARFQIGAASGRWADAAEISLPVWTPATTEAFATYGEIDDGGITQPVKAPADVFKQFGGLEVTTSSTQLQELTDAFIYLVAYPYECAEQISSRVMGVAALKDVLAAFDAKGLPKPEEMKAAMARDIKKLRSLQNDDGGFAFWKRNDESWPYISIHVAHALQRAKEKGFDVPSEMLDRSKDYLRRIEQHIPHYYSIEARRALIAYALYVRTRMNDRDTARARKLIAEAGLEHLSLEANGWLLSVLTGDAKSSAEVEAIRRHLNNRASETAGAAHFTDSYTDGDYLLLHSSRRADGVILEALIKDQPQGDLIPKIVRGLLGHRTAGRWENTQENVFILLALDRYFNAYEKVTPDFIARAWLGERFAGEQNYRGRTTDSNHFNVPMRYLAEKSGAQNLTLTKEGAGRLYYRIGMQYAPTSLKLAAADYGFTVERVYEAVDNPSDVTRDKEGTWHVKAGARVRVRLTLAAQSRRYHVALVDPMPAGLESLNPELATTGTIPQDQKETDQKGGYWWWYRSWFEHQNFRDERAEAFTSLLWEGVYNYTYVARATTPGNFVVPPAKAEEMYHPETFGRGASDRVVVE
jgi:alpha-2-macroglobulin